MNKLMTRKEFRLAVFGRDRGLCVLCRSPAVDPHHILERRLFPDGGYYLDNGASLCAVCHLACEATDVEVEQVRAAARVTTPLLPPDFDPRLTYDKWGNEILADGSRRRGPLFADEGMRKILGRKLALFAD